MLHALLIAVAYVAVASLWALYQDGIYVAVTQSETYMAEAEGLVDLVAIAAMGVALYYLISRAAEARERSGEELRESEELYRTLAEASQDMIFIVDRDDTVRYVNSHAASSIGMSPDSIVGRERGELFGETDGDRQRKNLAMVIELGRPLHFEGRTMFPGGERWLDTWLVPLSGRDGRADRVLGISRDLTKRKRAEEALEENARRIRALEGNIPRAMIYQIVRAPDGVRRFTYVGEGVQTLYGCSPEEALADSSLIYGRVHEEDRERLIAEEEAANAAEGILSTEVRMRNPDGGVRWSLFRSQPRRLEDGSTCWDGIEVDITERKRAE